MDEDLTPVLAQSIEQLRRKRLKAAVGRLMQAVSRPTPTVTVRRGDLETLLLVWKGKK